MTVDQPKFKLSSNGQPKPILANAAMILRNLPVPWSGMLCFDAFAMETVLACAPPWLAGEFWEPRPWGPDDDLLATTWFQENDLTVSKETTAQAVEMVARDRPFHPVIDYLDHLKHDGTFRTKEWLSTFLGVEPTRYSQAVARAMLIGAVARIMQPGCKVDTVPILEGPQGARKSTAIRTLFDPWFSDEIADLGSKDAAMQTRGIWGIEISELDAMSRGEVSKIKAFISRTTDRFRPPYGNRIIESPRSCVFWGSTNSDDYLKDATGGRRFWPIKVGKIDIDGLAEARDQLWAEATMLYRAGVPWWLTGDDLQRDAEEQQRSRYAGDPWDGLIERYVATCSEVTVDLVLRDGIGLDASRWGQIEMNRVARSLRSIGWLRHQRRTGDKRSWVYRRPVTGDEIESDSDNGTTVTTFRSSAA